MKIDEQLSLISYSYQDPRHGQVVFDFQQGPSKSKFIHDIQTRLTNIDSKTIFGKGYLICYQEQIVGYFYLSPIKKERLEVEYALLKEAREKGYGKLFLTKISDYLLQKFPIKELYVTIDPSNEKSISVAEASSFFFDEEDYEKRGYQGLMTFVKENPTYQKGKSR